MKLESKVVKIYKPEISTCPKCGNKLKYAYTISNKVVQFTSGKIIRIKNLGYSCQYCCDNLIYFSQTARKLSFKGYTYSCKTVCLIDYYKRNGYSRDNICDILTQKGFYISDRNIDILYKKIRTYINNDYDKLINDYYTSCINSNLPIRLSIDLITIKNNCYVIFYDFYKGEILTIWIFDSLEDTNLVNILKKYLTNPNIDLIISVRSYVSKFVPILKSIVAPNVKFISYLKF